MDVSENEEFLNMAILIGNMMINHWILRTLFSDKPNISIYPYAKWFNTHGFKTLERCGRLNQDSSGLYRSCLQHGDPVAWPRCEDHLQCSVPCTVCCVKVPEICTIRAYKSPQPWKTHEKTHGQPIASKIFQVIYCLHVGPNLLWDPILKYTGNWA